MWNRTYVPKLRTGEVPWLAGEASLTGLAPGSRLRILSHDPGDGGMSCLWHLPPGWAQPLPYALAADAELFVLEGELDEDGHRVRRGNYVHRRAGTLQPRVATRGGALLYAMWSATPALRETAAGGSASGGPADDATVGSEASLASADWIDSEAMADQPTPVVGPPLGINVRVLRRDVATGGMTLIVDIPRGWEEARSRHHDCVEESYKLHGDIWMHENHRPHVLEAGDYFFRPPRIKHGPMRTLNGTASLIRFSATVVNHYGPLDDDERVVEPPRVRPAVASGR